MERKTNTPEIRKVPQMFGDMNTEAPLWILIPKALAAISLLGVLILLIFWLRFGELSGFAFGFVTFSSVLQILIIVGLRFQNRIDFHASKARKDWIDKIGAWWLMACAFGALFGWICGNLADAFPSFDTAFQAAKVFFTIVLPITTMLPNLRYIRGKASAIQIPILFFVTALPVLVGINSLLSLWNKFSR